VSEENGLSQGSAAFTLNEQAVSSRSTSGMNLARPICLDRVIVTAVAGR
jgi:hypothetical protein